MRVIELEADDPANPTDHIADIARQALGVVPTVELCDRDEPIIDPDDVPLWQALFS